MEVTHPVQPLTQLVHNSARVMWNVGVAGALTRGSCAPRPAATGADRVTTWAFGLLPPGISSPWGFYPYNLFHYLRVRRRLSELLECDIDLVTRPALREEMREEILREAVDVT